jgi:hypothetical protein
MLGLRSKLEIKEFITQVITRPDEKYVDKYDQDVEYYLRKLNDKFLCVIVVRKDVVTAYLINQKKYNKYRATRWL